MVMLESKEICELRKALGITAKQFAERCGVTLNTVFRWEGGSRYASRRHQAVLNELLKQAKDEGLLQSA